MPMSRRALLSPIASFLQANTVSARRRRAQRPWRGARFGRVQPVCQVMRWGSPDGLTRPRLLLRTLLCRQYPDMSAAVAGTKR